MRVGVWSLAADLLERDVMIFFEQEHFQSILLSTGKAFRFSSIPSWGRNSEIAADTCYKEATEDGTPDSTSCQHSSYSGSDPELATHLCGLQHDVFLEQLVPRDNKIGSEGAQAGEGKLLHCVVQSTVLSYQDLQARGSGSPRPYLGGSTRRKLQTPAEEATEERTRDSTS